MVRNANAIVGLLGDLEIGPWSRLPFQLHLIVTAPSYETQNFCLVSTPSRVFSFVNLNLPSPYLFSSYPAIAPATHTRLAEGIATQPTYNSIPASSPKNMENRPQPRLEDPFGASPDQKTAHNQDQSQASNLRSTRRAASKRPLGQVYYSREEVVKLTQEIYDDTVNEVLLNLFIDWVRQKPENFAQAREHIRELSLDQASYTLVEIKVSINIPARSTIPHASATQACRDSSTM